MATENATRRLAVRQQGHYAGAITRFVAYVIDAAVVSGIYAAVVAGINYAVKLVTKGHVDVHMPVWLVAVTYGIWWVLYFGYPWAVSGRTAGMSLLGIRVVARDGDRLSWRRAFVRALALPLGFLTLGLGFVGIVTGRERRALHDVIAGSTVVYAWDARAAQLRFLAGDKAA